MKEEVKLCCTSCSLVQIRKIELSEDTNYLTKELVKCERRGCVSEGLIILSEYPPKI